MSRSDSRVYIHKDLSASRKIIDPENIDLVLTVNWQFDAIACGIAPELVHRLYDDHDGMQLHPGSREIPAPLQVLYVSPDDKDEPLHLLNFISLINGIGGVAVSIYCSDAGYREVKKYANTHIRFILKALPGKRREPPRLSCDLVITYGPGALHFIRQNVPVLIAGPCGWGGMVKPEIFPYLLRDGLMGRPGGRSGENIPVEMLKDELSSLKKITGLPALLAELKERCEQLAYTPLSDAAIFVDQARRLHSSLYDKKKRWMLIPCIASNIRITEKEGMVYLHRTLINDTLAVADPSHKAFLANIDGRTDCRSLHACGTQKENEFWQNLYALWNKKIIIFQHVPTKKKETGGIP